jgi:Protein of unknown function (DUF2807).
MKRYFLVSWVMITSVLCSCSKETISGSGNLVSENRSISNFTAVSVDGTFNLTVKQSDEHGVHIIADDNVIAHVKTEVDDDVLKLYLESGINYKNIDLVVEVSTVQLNGLKNQGSSNIDIKAGNEHALFYIANEGSAKIDFSGVSQELYLHNEGSGRLSGFLFTSSNCLVDAIGSGDIEISCVESLDVTINGSANVFYKGTPNITSDIEGSGKVINKN